MLAAPALQATARTRCSCMDYCCRFSPLWFTGNAVSLYRVRSLSSSTTDACLLWQPMGMVHAFH